MNLETMLGGLPVMGSMLAPVTSLLDSVGLNDPTSFANKAPITDAQKALIAKLTTAISNAATSVSKNLPVGLPVSPFTTRQDIASESEDLNSLGPDNLFERDSTPCMFLLLSCSFINLTTRRS
jgi:hypothetical protein